MSRQCLAHFFVCVLYDGLARFFVTSVFCALFWMYRVGLFVTVVLGALFCMCSVNCLVRSSVTQCFLCVVLPFCHSSVSRTVWYKFSWQFVTLGACALFCISFLWLFGTLVPRALFWMCSGRLLLTLVFCALFWMCSVWLFGTFVVCALFCMCSFDCLLRSSFVHCFYVFCCVFVTQVSRALFGMSFVDSLLRSVWLFGTLVPCALCWMCAVKL